MKRELLVVLLVLAACGGENPGPDRICVPNEQELCACPDGSLGNKVCSWDGMSYGECGPCCTPEKPLCNGICAECWGTTVPYCDSSGFYQCCDRGAIFCDTYYAGAGCGGACYTNNDPAHPVDCTTVVRCPDGRCYGCPSGYVVNCTTNRCE